MLMIIWIVIAILERNKKQGWIPDFVSDRDLFFICGVSIKVKEQRFYDSCLHQITWGDTHDLGPFVCQLNRTLSSVTLPCPNLQVNWKERSLLCLPLLISYWTTKEQSRRIFFSRLIKWDINSLQMAHSSSSIYMISKLAQNRECCLHSRPDSVS